MTERTMLLRCAAAGRYVIMGTDFPSARVFDTATSALSAVVELPPRHRSALSSISLTAVALGSLTQQQQQQYSHNNNEEEEDVAQEADLLQTYYAAVGLSNGTVLVHNITRDVLVDHVLLSSTQRAVRSMSIAGPCLVALCEDNMVYLLDLTQPQLGLRGRIPVPPGATAVATSVDSVLQSEASSVKEAVLHILVAGPAITVLRVRFHAAGAAVHELQRGPEVNQLMSFASQGTGVDYCWIGYDATSDNNGSDTGVTRRLVAVTASAQEGMIRIWDVSSEASQAQRCRRTLLCGQRMANLCVQSAYSESKEYFTSSRSNIVVATTFTGAVLVWNLGHELLPRIAEPLPLQPALVLIADKGTSRLLYGFLRPPTLLNTTHEETTTAGNTTITTKKTKKKSTGDAEAALRHVALLLLRGRFALPLFEDIQLARLLEVNRNTGYSRAARQLLMSTGLQSVTNGTVVSQGKEERSAQGAMRVLPVPMSDTLTTNKAAMTHDLQGRNNRKRSNGLSSNNNEATGAATAFEVADTVWANHRAQVAAKATITATESFPAVRAHRAASTKELPIQHLSLEQRLRRLQNETASNDAAGDAAEQQTSVTNNQGLATAVTTTTTSNALGLATVPLYQALHASDTTAVMELLSIAARSHAGMRATVLSLQLPYCLQLLHILSLRLGILANSSQPAKNESTAEKKAEAVINTEGVPSADTQGNNNANDVVKSTGAVVGGGLAATSLRSPLLEWVDCIIQYRGMELYAAQQEAKATQLMTNPSETMSSPPKDFIAPILHQYRVTCAQYDKLATMYGRLSIFQGVRASEKNVFYQHSRKMQSSNLERGSTAAAARHSHKSKQQSEGKEWTGAGAVLQDDLIFPAMFAEVRTRRGGLRAVRVRSRLELAQARRCKATKDAALLRRAKALARDADDTDINSKSGKNKKKGKSILDESDDDEGDEHAGKGGSVLDEMALAQMDHNDGELDLDELAAMQLDSSSEEEEGEEEEEDEKGAGGQVARAKMLADDPSAIGYAGAAREEKDDMDEEESHASSEAEFSSASDDVLDSEAESEDDEEDESDEEEDEEGDESDEDKRAFGSQDGDDGDDEEDDEDDDGMGEDMQELLAEHETAEDRTEKRKSKRLRVD